MSAVFDPYKPRAIMFKESLYCNGWNIKVYTITNQEEFKAKHIFQNIGRHVPVWIDQIENTTLPTYKQAFLIVHEAREGVWILLNWWTGGEMIETKVLFSSFETPEQITDSPYGTNSLLCVWELEVFAHERRAWIRHILSKANTPDYLAYTKDTLRKEV